MPTLFNLLNAQPKLYDGPPRDMDPAFGLTYFDGSRHQGYGGYRYDGRWKPVCEAAVKRYGLNAKSRILDLGCGKGFFLADLIQVCPGISVVGIDISRYAIQNAHPAVRPFLQVGNQVDLSDFPDGHFDFVSSMNALHFLPPEGAGMALRELTRVGKGRYFVQVDAYTNEVERERLQAWAPIIKTVYSVDRWFELFRKVGYEGDCWWTFVRPLTPEKFETSGSRSR